MPTSGDAPRRVRRPTSNAADSEQRSLARRRAALQRSIRRGVARESSSSSRRRETLRRARSSAAAEDSCARRRSRNPRAHRSRRAIACGAIAAEDDQLGQHRIVVDAHLAAGRHAGVDANARAFGRRPARDRSGRGQHVIGRIFGVDARFDRPAARAHVVLRESSDGSPPAMRSCHCTRSMP